MMRPAALAIAVIAAVSSPPAGADTGWRIERSSPRTATSVIREIGPSDFVGLTCWQGAWTLFFNHHPREAARCEATDACHGSIRRVQNRLQLDGGPETTAEFELFSDVFYAVEPLDRPALDALLAASAVTLRFDPRLVEVWGSAEATLPVDGLRGFLEREGRRVTCPR